MAMTVQECQAIMDACDKNKVKLSIGYRMQHEPNTMRFGEYAKASPYGDITSVFTRAGYSGNGFPEDYWRMKKDMGGGAMYDMGVYPLNGARYLTKMEPVAISATHEKSHPHIFKEVDETTYFTLEFANGLSADCGTSIVKSYNVARIECENGWYELDPMSQYSGVKGLTSDGKSFAAISNMQQTLQMDNDALAIINDTPVLVPGSDGMKDIHVVQGAFASAAANGKRVLL
jgi:glucose-fructose oxidoreductase